MLIPAWQWNSGPVVRENVLAHPTCELLILRRQMITNTMGDAAVIWDTMVTTVCYSVLERM